MGRDKSKVKAAPVVGAQKPGLPQTWLAGITLVVLVLLTYSRAPFIEFVWDDDSYVTRNATLRSLSGLGKIWTEITATPQYYPLVHSSFWIEYHLWGLNPVGYHAVNVILHGLAVLLLWRIFAGLRFRGAWIVAALFAVHPVEVESVAWVTERKNVLSAVFYLASAYSYLRWSSLLDLRPRTTKESPQPYLYFLSLGFFVLALLSKTVVCTLPAALLIARWWIREKTTLKEARPFVPFIVVGGCLGLLTAWLERHHVKAEGGVWDLSLAQRILIAGRAFWFYAGKLLWPAKLTFSYPRWDINPNVWPQWIFPVAAAGLILIPWTLRGRLGRGPASAVAFFLLTLAPALGFFNIFPFRYSFVADHFQYLASVGLFALAGVALCRMPRFVPAILVIVLALLSWRQTSIYRNLETLWRDTINKNPGSWMAHSNLAMVLFNQGHSEESILHLEKAYSLNPNEFEIENNFGLVLLETGRADEALPHLQKAVSMGPIDAPVHYYLATALYHGGRFAEATEELEQSIAFDPKYVPARSELGSILLAEGRSEEALTQLQTAVAQDPEFLSARFNFANTLIQLGRQKEAVEQLDQVLKEHPDSAEAQKNMAWVLATSADDSIRDGRRAVELAESARQKTQGRDPVVLITLAAAYAEAGRFSEAITSAQEALQVATAAGNTTLAQGIGGYITLYQYGQPYRDTR